jgi:hypothetical protein
LSLLVILGTAAQLVKEMISEPPAITQVQAVYSFKGKNNDEVGLFNIACNMSC